MNVQRVSEVEVSLVVRDGDDRLACRLDARKDGPVKSLTISRILVSGPLVEHQDGP